MPRLPRLQYPGAIYHIVTRGDGRRKIFHDDGHYERFTRGLAEEVDRSGWIVIAFCWMPNHIHALIKTLEPNLCRGMQHWLPGYANWYARRAPQMRRQLSLDSVHRSLGGGNLGTQLNTRSAPQIPRGPPQARNKMDTAHIFQALQVPACSSAQAKTVNAPKELRAYLSQ